MKRYYLSPIIGSGTGKDPFRPAIAGNGYDWAMIDLREDVSKSDGLCIAFADTEKEIVGTGIDLISDSDIKSVPVDQSKKDAFTSRIGVSLTAFHLPDMIMELLLSKRAGLCNPIRPEADGKFRIYLGGQIYGDLPTERKPGTIHDNFNRSNRSLDGDTSSDGNWDWAVYSGGDLRIYNNMVAGGYVSQSYGYADISLGSADNYAQAKIYRYTSAATGGMTARGITAAKTCYIGGTDCASAWYIWKIVNGSVTELAAYSTGYNYPNGNTYYFSADGSTLTLKQDGSTKIATTDTSITSGNYAGLIYGTEDFMFWDDFEASALVSVVDKSSSDSGAGVDARSAQTGASSAADTGTGADAAAGYPAAALTGAEAAAGIESLLGRILAVDESGSGLEVLTGGNPLAELLASDDGAGLDACIALMQYFAVVSGDAGLGSDAMMALLGRLTAPDNGSAVDTLITRLLEKKETGTAGEYASLLASVFGAGESGSGAETSLFLPAIVAGEAGLGSEFVFLLKDIVGSDTGKAKEMLKYLMETASQGTDMRLSLRSGQAGRAGDNRQVTRRRGQIELPSREVNL